MISRYEELMLTDYLKGKENAEKLKEDALSRLDNGEPIGYIVGEQYFYNICLKVNDSVLIPRPDTERLVEYAINNIPKNARFIDLGTGSGCISLSILYNRCDLSCCALDFSENALCVAKENAEKYSLTDRIDFIHSDMLKEDAQAGPFDAVISNPPYIKTDVIKDYPSLSYEPISALDGGFDGLVFYRHIVSAYKDKLTPNGFFLFEIGYDQKDDIRKVAENNGFNVRIIKDYSGNDRVAVLTR